MNETNDQGSIVRNCQHGVILHQDIGRGYGCVTEGAVVGYYPVTTGRGDYRSALWGQRLQLLPVSGQDSGGGNGQEQAQGGQQAEDFFGY